MNVTLAYSTDTLVTPIGAIVRIGTHCTLAPPIDAFGPPSRAIAVIATLCNENERHLAVMTAFQIIYY